MASLSVGACERTAVDNHAAGAQAPTASGSRRISPPCTYQENGFRSGVNPPREIQRTEPDLTGLPPLPGDQYFIVEARIDATGRVTEDCMLRGSSSPDADRRVLDAVRQWRFEPPRLIRAVDSRDGHWDAGAAVPIFMTVTVRLIGIAEQHGKVVVEWKQQPDLAIKK